MLQIFLNVFGWKARMKTKWTWYSCGMNEWTSDRFIMIHHLVSMEVNHKNAKGGQKTMSERQEVVEWQKNVVKGWNKGWGRRMRVVEKWGSWSFAHPHSLLICCGNIYWMVKWTLSLYWYFNLLLCWLPSFRHLLVCRWYKKLIHPCSYLS